MLMEIPAFKKGNDCKIFPKMSEMYVQKVELSLFWNTILKYV